MRIHCQDVTKHFGDCAAVEGVSLHIDHGICALLGPNGAGKSTLLKLLCGLLPPDSGEVRVGDSDPWNAPAELRRSIGVLPDGLALFSSLTVTEHFAMASEIYGLSKPQAAQRAESLIYALQLDVARHTLIEHCSHGTKKKTALSLALLHNPQVLLLDEPLAGLDPLASRAVQRILVMAAERGTTIVLSEHSLHAIERIASQVLLLDHGKLVHSAAAQAERSLEDLYSQLVEPPPLEGLEWLGHKR